MSDSVEKGLLPTILVKRDNYYEWNQSIMRKLNEVPIMVGWIQGNQDAETGNSLLFRFKLDLQDFNKCRNLEPAKWWTKKLKNGALIRCIW